MQNHMKKGRGKKNKKEKRKLGCTMYCHPLPQKTFCVKTWMFL